MGAVRVFDQILFSQKHAGHVVFGFPHDDPAVGTGHLGFGNGLLALFKSDMKASIANGVVDFDFLVGILAGL